MRSVVAIPIALAVVGLVGCSFGSVSDVGDASSEPSAHVWAYHPRHDVYHCPLHEHFVRQEQGAWREVERVGPLDLDGRSYLVQDDGADPSADHDEHLRQFGREPSPLQLEADDPNSHSWIYYPESKLYTCQRHRHSFQFSSGAWVAGDLKSRLAQAGSGFAVDYVGPDPYRYVKRHEE